MAFHTWGSQHAAAWLPVATADRAVEVVVVRLEPDTSGGRQAVLDRWTSTPPEFVTMDHE